MIFVVDYYYLASGLINYLSSSCCGGGGASRINIIITNYTSVVVGVGEGHAQTAAPKE